MPRKPFQFRLEASLNRRIMERDQLRAAAATLRSRIARERDDLIVMEHEAKQLRDAIDGNTSATAGGAASSNRDADWFTAMRNDLGRLCDRFCAQQANVNVQTELVTRLDLNLRALGREVDRAHQRVLALESLKAAQREAFRRNQVAQEQKTIDEYSAIREARRRQK